ncbi:MAG TPA: glutamate synthase large subunit [Bacillota bacterium]|nr:glutamate synthase large subunit [Bacillota bacterium]
MKETGRKNYAQGLYDPHFEHDACGIGFVVNIKGEKSNEIIRQGLQVLVNLDHRGARGAEPNTGDGAGILMQIPHKFFQKTCSMNGFKLPEPGQYAVGMVFLPQEPFQRAEFEKTLAKYIHEEGQTLLGWRTVPTFDGTLGESAKACKPYIRQVFIGRGPEMKDDLAFERRLYVIRKRAEKSIRYSAVSRGDAFYIASLSGRTIVYKGMLTPTQLEEYYPDLSDPAMESALALVHSRFSTNTFPSWERAHPYRYLIHNGEINTLRGNINWMHARESLFQSEQFGDDVTKIRPIISPDGSDSAMFDECLEFLMLGGWSLPQAMMMMVPEPWSKHESMSPEKKAFYEYHSCLMEPWDGPAAMAFSDGSIVGAVLDRNGLRPARYYITGDGTVVLSSEVGVIEFAPEQIVEKGRLQPGRMLLIDTKAGRIVTDEELKTDLSRRRPYREWLDQHLLTLDDVEEPHAVNAFSEETASLVETAFLDETTTLEEAGLIERQKAFGYTYEELRMIITPMAQDGVEPVGAMGTDTPLAVLSEKPQALYNYFKQLFAQVTNPPIDANREEIVTGTEIFLGSEGNLLDPKPESCRQIKLTSPMLTNAELNKLKYLKRPGFKTITLPALFKVSEDSAHVRGAGLKQAMDELCLQAGREIKAGANIIILSDRGVNSKLAPIPALLAVAGVHHYLIREKLRTQVSLIVESGEPREVHHFALLLGYGASAINPYLISETLDDIIQQGMLKNLDHHHAEKNYLKATLKGIVKVLSKMGISTIQSYQGAQIFEALGLNQALIDQYFTGTPSRIGGIGLSEIAQEAVQKHQTAFLEAAGDGNVLESGGYYQWRRNGEYHLYNPETIHKVQQACRNNDYQLYKEYAALINNQTQRQCTIRGLMEFNYLTANPVPLDEVESVESICKRFKTGAMSYGSISQEAHEALAIAMNRIGGRSNTGEGGEDPVRFTPEPNGDSRCSAIKQVASGRFGVTSNYLVNAREIQIKIAQGAKPGEGGQLPGRKVYPWIARVRYSTPGVGLISPPPHHDIYSIEDLAELIHDLKNANPQARISVKLVSEVGVGTVAAGVAKGKADLILISGYDGGTGASPRTSIRHAGLPWELGLAETHQTLLLNNLRSRVVLETDGKLMTGRDVVIAALLGAEEYGFATLPLVALGCVMMRVCNLDTCPVGVATQNPELRKKFSGDPAYIVNLMHFIAQEMREIMAGLGFRTINEMIGRTDKLKQIKDASNPKANLADLSNILYQPEVGPEVGRYCQISQDHGLEKALDQQKLLEISQPALLHQKPVEATLPIRNTDRVVGTMLGSEVTKRYGAAGLPEDTIRFGFQGSAGQSFGAFIPRGITLTLEGDANDYLGKGLSGGKIIVYPPVNAGFKAEENIVVGNVAFYGATDGEAYIYGVAGERFCVRNSGVNAVVEAVGDHGCEYMTGGRVVILGSTGRNFAAGMSGGIAYVLDEAGDFNARCNPEMVDLEALNEPDEINALKNMIQKHYQYTKSAKAAEILDAWAKYLPKFIKVLPRDYGRMLKILKNIEDKGALSNEEAVMNAFYENKSDLKRVSGN